MSKFKVGDRVRFRVGVRPSWEELQGLEGVIVGMGSHPIRPVTPPWDCYVNFGSNALGAVNCMFAELDPLTPPAVDTWAADAVRKVTKPQHVEPVKVPQGDELPALHDVLRYYQSLNAD